MSSVDASSQYRKTRNSKLNCAGISLSLCELLISHLSVLIGTL